MPPFIEQRYFEVSQRHGWLLPFGRQAALRLVAARHPDALTDDVLSIISLAARAQDYQPHHHSSDTLDTLIPT